MCIERIHKRYLLEGHQNQAHDRITGLKTYVIRLKLVITLILNFQRCTLMLAYLSLMLLLTALKFATLLYVHVYICTHSLKILDLCIDLTVTIATSY